jgi:hypothetical protein
MAEVKGSRRAARGGERRPERLRLLEERVTRIERMLEIRSPLRRVEADSPRGPRCPGCRLEVEVARGRCPWCGFVFEAVRGRRRSPRS